MKYAGMIPDGKFATVVADPPWPGGLRFPTFKKDRPDSKPVTAATWTYDQMSIEELKAMAPDIIAHTTDDSHLWLWITNMFLLNGAVFEVCKAWGYAPKALLTWDKMLVGLGRWMRGQTEHCIWATSMRGKGAHLLHDGSATLPTLIHEKRRGHSMKPDTFWRYPETLSRGPRLELFSRGQREGWATVRVDIAPRTYEEMIEKRYEETLEDSVSDATGFSGKDGIPPLFSERSFPESAGGVSDAASNHLPVAKQKSVSEEEELWLPFIERESK